MEPVAQDEVEEGDGREDGEPDHQGQLVLRGRRVWFGHDAWKKCQDNWKNRYKLAAREREAVGEDFAEPWNFQYRVLIASIPRSFTKWFPNSGRAAARSSVAARRGAPADG